MMKTCDPVTCEPVTCDPVTCDTVTCDCRIELHRAYQMDTCTVLECLRCGCLTTLTCADDQAEQDAADQRFLIRLAVGIMVVCVGLSVCLVLSRVF